MFREIFFWFTEYLNYFALIFFGIKLFLKKYDVQTGRKEWVENVIISVIAMPVISICTYNFRMYGYSNMVTYLMIFFIFLLLKVIQKEKVRGLFSLVVIYVNVLRIIDLLINAIILEVNLISRQQPLEFIRFGYQRSIYLLFLSFVYYMIYIFLWKGKIFEYLFENYFFRNIVCIFSFLGVICFCRVYFYGYEERIIQYWFFYLLCVAIIFGVFMFYIVRIKNEEENKVLNMRNNLMKEHYFELRKAYDMNKVLYHDFKNHVLVLNRLLVENKVEESIKYINSFMKEFSKISYKINSGCEIFDIIINSKLSEIEDKKINFTYDVPYIGKIDIDDVDFCALFANLLDNSIEACETLDENQRNISLKIAKNKGFLFIKLENSVGKNIKSKEEFFVTNKNNKEFHGVGLKSIERVVKKYDGYIDYFIYDNKIEIFVNILLKN